MQNIFFDSEGSLNINELIANHPSYIKILEDNVVTDEELKSQSDIVLELFKKIESVCSDEQKILIKEMLIETNVLNAVYKKYYFQQSSDFFQVD
jgi:hypothetical protein